MIFFYIKFGQKVSFSHFATTPASYPRAIGGSASARCHAASSTKPRAAQNGPFSTFSRMCLARARLGKMALPNDRFVIRKLRRHGGRSLRTRTIKPIKPVEKTAVFSQLSLPCLSLSWLKDRFFTCKWLDTTVFIHLRRHGPAQPAENAPLISTSPMFVPSLSW